MITLAAVGGLGWLHRLFGVVVLTHVALAEVMPGEGRIGEGEIGRAIEEKRLEVIEDKWPTPQFSELDEAEASVLRAAANLGGPTCC